MPAHPCPRCRKNHLGALDLCERCRTELSEDYLAGASAIPEMLAVIEAARAVLVTAPVLPTTTCRELAATLEAFDRARGGVEEEPTRPSTPSAREVARGRPETLR